MTGQEGWYRGSETLVPWDESFSVLGGKMNPIIRPGTEEDLPEMLRLWRETMDFHARLEPRFRPHSSPTGECAWEKHLRENIWGNEDWCVFEPEQYGYVTDVVVDRAARRRGVGRALLEALKAWFRERGVSHLELMVAHNNSVSQAFWRAGGCTDYMDILWYDLEAE